MTETIHCAVLHSRDVGIEGGRLRIAVLNDVQQFNLTPDAMIDLGLALIDEAHRQITERAEYRENMIDILRSRINEQSQNPDGHSSTTISPSGEDHRRAD